MPLLTPSEHLKRLTQSKSCKLNREYPPFSLNSHHPLFLISFCLQIDRLSEREKTIGDLEDELGRVRSEYSALLTKMTIQKYNGDEDSKPGASPSNHTKVTVPSNVVDQPLLTANKLKTLRAKAGASRIPTRKDLSGLKPASEPVLFKSSGFKTLSETLVARNKASTPPASPSKPKGASSESDRGPSRAKSEASGQMREADTSDAWKNIEERRKKMEELARMTFETEPSMEDDDDDDDTRRSSLSLLSEDGESVAPKYKASQPSVVAAVAVEEAALAMSEEALTSESLATDAEFAGFQAQFVGGMTLGVLGSTLGSKTKRRSKVFTIRFLPKKGLTLCWGKRDTIVFSSVTEVNCGGGGRSSTPSKSSRVSWSSSSPVDKDKVLVVHYNDIAGAMTPTSSAASRSKDSSPRNSRDSSAGDLVLCLEAKSQTQRDHIARCMRRLAQQEKERSSFLGDM